MAKKLEKNYKFKELKTYCSTYWLSDGKKRYRRVFDNKETTYIYAELTFYNKLFDEEDWNTEVVLKAYHLKSNQPDKLLCEVKKSLTISRDENIIAVREGWGNAEAGSFWKRGDYKWEAWIDGELMGTAKFYVESGGIVTETENPYFEITSIKLYEGPNEGTTKDKRVYYSTLDGTTTRYLWCEFGFKNLQADSWYCELIFNFYNDSNQLFGSTKELKMINPDEGENFIVTSGWGTDDAGSWKKDKYTAEIIFMDQLVATVPFEISDEFIEGEPPVITPTQLTLGVQQAPLQAKMDEQGLEELIGELDEMVGLDDIKDQLRKLTQYLKFLQLRRDKGMDMEETVGLNAVFMGNPGTGKTTVAKKLGKIYKKMGLIRKEDVLEVDRSDLVGPYIGQTAPKTREILNKAKGGILFIDEAYSLARSEDDKQDFGNEVIELLVKEMTNPKSELVVVVAGYPKQMNTFLESNPGLKSRFSHYFDFADYTPQELMQIAEYTAVKKSVSLAPESKDMLYQYLQEEYRNRDESFGNARLVNSIVNEAKMNLGIRLMKEASLDHADESTLSTIVPEDISQIFGQKKSKSPDIKLDEALLKQCMEDLRQLVGLGSVKEEVGELIKLVKYYRETGKEVLNRFSLHTVFLGNPGTGKTTVARILAKVYKALGILERGHLVECDRQALVAGYIGQTAIKTNDMIDRAMGGVLFVDEAYALTSSGSDNDFGKEAVETLLKRMEDSRGKFILIVAGYTDKMNHFLEANPGLKSRFDHDIMFGDYTADELYQIGLDMLKKENLHPDAEAADFFRQHLAYALSQKDKYFGNARSVRKMVEDMIREQHLRMAELDPGARTPEMMRTLTLADLSDLKKTENKLTSGGSKPIGFKSF